MTTLTNETMRVPYGQTVHGEEEIAAVVEVLRTSTQMGTQVRTFEARIAELFAKRHGVMVNSGSSAIYLATELLGLPAGSEVITPALTFATTVAPLVKAGLVPPFVDVEPDTFNIDVARSRPRSRRATRAIDGALAHRQPARLGPDRGDRPRTDLVVVEDSADTLGATLRGTSTGTRSDISTTSFYGSHVINCAGNGGMLCMNRDDWAEEARLLRSWGRSSSLFVDSENVENRFNVDVGGIPYDAKFVFSRHRPQPRAVRDGRRVRPRAARPSAANIEARERNFAAAARVLRATTRTGSCCRARCRTRSPAGSRSR